MNWNLLAIALPTTLLTVFMFHRRHITEQRERDTPHYAYLLYINDGLFDIFLGLALLLIGFGLDIYQAYSLLGFALLYVVFLAAKQTISMPRLLQKDYDAEAIERVSREIMGTTSSILLFGLLAYLVVYAGNVERLRGVFDEYLSLLFLLFIVSSFVLMGLRRRRYRMLFYAGLFAGAYVASTWFMIPIIYTLGGLGVLCVAIGSVILNRFLLAH